MVIYLPLAKARKQSMTRSGNPSALYLVATIYAANKFLNASVFSGFWGRFS
jgi:hypothetical protein